MMFRVGQKVVCVHDGSLEDCRRRSDLVRNYIEKGKVYTIRWIGEFGYVPDREFGPAVRLTEVVRPNLSGWEDYPFRACRFRPLAERKTDISFAHEILRKVTRKDRVRA